MSEFTGKSAIVTGGTAGIGKEIALSFVEQGASVAIFGTNPERAQKVKEELEEKKISSDQKILVKLVNVASFQEVETAIQEVLNEFGKVDCLVNNAGITRDQLLMKLSEEDWDQVIEVNLKSAFNTCKALSRPMMKARSGSIINISSVIGLTGNAGQTNYAASKAGMIGFTKSLAKELAKRGVRANSVAPGYIETQMTEVLPEAVKNAVLEKIPMGEIGKPRDIANAVLFLASERSRYITGQTLTVDGGMVI